MRTPRQKLGNPKPIFPYSPDFGWRDITGEINVRGVGANDPTWGQMGAGPLYGYKFAVGDECWMVYHIPHDILPGGDIHFHAHWAPSGTDANVVKWQWQYVYAKGFNQAAYAIGSESVATAEQAGPGVAWQHMVTETDAVTIADLDEPDGLIYCHIERITNGASPVSENADDIFLLTADVHYQSTDRATVNKAPDFYV